MSRLLLQLCLLSRSTFICTSTHVLLSSPQGHLPHCLQRLGHTYRDRLYNHVSHLPFSEDKTLVLLPPLFPLLCAILSCPSPPPFYRPSHEPLRLFTSTTPTPLSDQPHASALAGWVDHLQYQQRYGTVSARHCPGQDLVVVQLPCGWLGLQPPPSFHSPSSISPVVGPSEHDPFGHRHQHDSGFVRSYVCDLELVLGHRTTPAEWSTFAHQHRHGCAHWSVHRRQCLLLCPGLDERTSHVPFRIFLHRGFVESGLW